MLGKVMRKHPVPLLALVVLLLAPAAQAGDGCPGEIHGKVYGKGVSAADTVLVSALLASADEHLGETVRVQGAVVGCCKKRGCWIEIASDQEFQTIMLKVDDGEIVFPMEVVGETAIVEGVLEGVPMDYEQACAYLEHEATCQGETFDKSQVPAEGITFYRIKGTGAVILEADDTKDS